MRFIPTILCVDDDEDDLFFIRDVIHAQPHSFDIVTARNGWDAFKFLEEAASTDNFPCLIIMDVNMPKMDGKQTIRKIREHEQLRQIPVVVFTTSENDADRNYFENQGIHFISKPFDYKQFTKEIIDLLAFCAEMKG